MFVPENRVLERLPELPLCVGYRFDPIRLPSWVTFIVCVLYFISSFWD